MIIGRFQRVSAVAGHAIRRDRGFEGSVTPACQLGEVCTPLRQLGVGDLEILGDCSPL